MPLSLISDRRQLLLAALSVPLAACAASATRPGQAGAERQLAALEQGFAGRVGVCALDTADGALLAWRGDERFPMCSSFKAMLAAAVLARSVAEPALLQRRLAYTRAELLPHSPVTQLHVNAGMTVSALCAATVQTSDNAAANVLLRLLGGPAALTAYMRGIGDTTFRLDRIEPELNTALPGDPRDTSTPRAMAQSLSRLLVGSALPPVQRMQLADWMRGTTTGDARIRAGMPAGWAVGDKTGTGAYGSASDIAIVWPPGRAPLLLAVYTTRDAADASARSEPIAAAARIVAQWALERG